MVKVYGAFERKLLMVGFDAGQVIEIVDHRAERQFHAVVAEVRTRNHFM